MGSEPSSSKPASRLRRWPRLGPYRLMKRLGAGAFADVYAAVRSGDITPVAVKVIPPGPRCSDNLRQRLLAEGHLAIGIEHPNLVRYLDVGEEDGAVYVVQELISGGDVATLYETSGGLVPPAMVAAIGRDAALGLHALHLRGLVHRDVKPANLLLTQDGRCKVADLGLARALGEETHVTAAGNVVGTPDFIAPEQVRDDPDLDLRADVYGLAASLYWLVTGRSPHEAPNMWTMLTRTVSEPFPDPLRLRPDLPPALAAVIRTAGEKDRDRRHSTAEALAEDLADVLAARPPRLAGSSRPHPRQASTACCAEGPVVLLIDDDPLIRRLYAGRLVVDAWRVETAEDGDAALASAQRHPPAVVVLDLMLASEPGMVVLRRLRALPEMAAVPVVVFTNLVGSQGASNLIHELGVSRVVGKADTNPRELSLLLRRLLRGQTCPRPQPVPAAGLARVALERLLPLLVDGSAEALPHALAELETTAHGLAELTATPGPPVATALALAVEHFARHLGHARSASATARQTLGTALTALIAAAALPPSGAPWQPGGILILESDPVVRRLAALALSHVHLAPRCAASASEALRLAEEIPLALVIADAALPGDLPAFLERLQPAVVVLAATAGQLEALPLGPGLDQIARPYQAAELAALALARLSRLPG